MKTLPLLGELIEALQPQAKLSTFTQHSKIILLLDRTLSPAGERRLKDLRCLGRGAEFAWPSPGVLSIPKFASKISTALVQKGHVDNTNRPIRFEELLLGLWLDKKQSHESLSLKVFEHELKIALRFATLGLSQKEWLLVLEETEKHSQNSAELSLWGERIFLFLESWKWCLDQKLSLSVWDDVYSFVHHTSIESLKSLAWLAVLERNPFHTKTADISFIVPEIQSAHPIEKAFLYKLSQIFPVEILNAPYTSTLNPEEPLFLESLPIVQQNETLSYHSPDDASIAWTFEDKVPGPIEALENIPHRFPLDLALKTWEDDNETLRILGLYCSFLDNSSDTQHPFHRFQNKSHFLKSWGLNNDPIPTPKKIVDVWSSECQPELKSAVIKSLESLSYSKLSQVFLYLSQSSLFRIERDALQHPRLSSNGIPLLTLPDLALSGSKNVFLWGRINEFRNNLAPQSSPVLKKQDWPYALRRIFTALGFTVPDPQIEQELLLGSLQALGSKLKVLEPTIPNKLNSSLAPQWKEPELLKRQSFSPSALEAYADCSLRYFVERILRPQPVEDWDPLPINALRFGNWVHAVLEKFLKQNLWTQIDTELPQLIHEEQRKAFISSQNQSYSPAYERILVQEEQILFERLKNHLLKYEKPLLDLIGPRTSLLTESKIKASFEGRTYNGKIDRIDQFSSQMNLLWDYKTGRIKETLPTQIKNNKFQWPLYAKLLQSPDLVLNDEVQTSISIAGGGYLNPVDSSGSHLMFFESQIDPIVLEKIINLSEKCGHKVEVIKTSKEENLNLLLSEKLKDISQLLEDGIIASTGDDAKHCVRCSVRPVCGKPHLETDSSNEAVHSI